jgi:hypothetical protein
MRYLLLSVRNARDFVTFSPNSYRDGQGLEIPQVPPETGQTTDFFQ